jgi:hypothetical protein
VYDLTNSPATVDLTKLYTTNYLQARQRHWLIDPSGSSPALRARLKSKSIGQAA